MKTKSDANNANKEVKEISPTKKKKIRKTLTARFTEIVGIVVLLLSVCVFLLNT